MSTMKLATLLSVSLLASAAAFAETSATSANVIGVLRVDSMAKRTIVAVPWVAAGVDAGNIKVTDIVKTSNLKVGDTLSYYKGDGTFDTWVLNAGTDGAAPAWVSANQVSQNGETGTSEDPAVQTLPRGGALILVRQKAVENGTAIPFYLQGQYSDVTATAPVIATGTAAEPTYNLIAHPGAKSVDVDLNTDIIWTNPNTTDRIFILKPNGLTVECQYRSGKWQYNTWAKPQGGGLMQEQWSDATVPAGTGFWYVSKGSSAPTLAWK